MVTRRYVIKVTELWIMGMQQTRTLTYLSVTALFATYVANNKWPLYLEGQNC